MFKWFKGLFKRKDTVCKDTVFCRDCRWCSPGLYLLGFPNSKWRFAECISPLNYKKPTDLKNHRLYLVGNGSLEVSKTRILIFCNGLRNSQRGCGKEGRWFEPMVVPQIPDSDNVL